MERVLENIYLVDTLKYVEPGTISAYVIELEKAVVVDPGTVKGANILLEELEKAGIKDKLEYIANTHIHIDHAGGSCVLVKHTNAKVIVHPKGAKHVINPTKLWESSKVVLGELAEVYGKPEPIDENRVISAEDGQKFDLGGDVLTAYYAPGHAPHMLAYHLEKSKVLFPDDAVGLYFEGSIFPTTPPPFDMEQALNTIERLMKLDFEYVAFAHFGITEEKEILKQAYDKIVMWGELAEKVVREGGNINDLISRILEADGDARRLKDKFKDRPIAMGFIQVAAAGLFDYAKKKV